MMDHKRSAWHLYWILNSELTDPEQMATALEEYMEDPQFGEHPRMMARGLARAVRRSNFPAFTRWAIKVERECLGH